METPTYGDYRLSPNRKVLKRKVFVLFENFVGVETPTYGYFRLFFIRRGSKTKKFHLYRTFSQAVPDLQINMYASLYIPLSLRERGVRNLKPFKIMRDFANPKKPGGLCFA